MAVDELNSLSAFIKVSKEVSLSDFNLFVEKFFIKTQR